MSETEAQRRRRVWGRIAFAIALIATMTGAIFGWIARFQ
jgi:hypothetical protein